MFKYEVSWVEYEGKEQELPLCRVYINGSYLRNLRRRQKFHCPAYVKGMATQKKKTIDVEGEVCDKKGEANLPFGR